MAIENQDSQSATPEQASRQRTSQQQNGLPLETLGYQEGQLRTDMRQKSDPMPLEIVSPRLLLRPFNASDAQAFTQIANDREIQTYLLQMPYPYELSHAKEALESYQRARRDRTAYFYAIVEKYTQRLVGNTSLTLDPHSPVAELGYWVARTHWGHGYCTEACRSFLMAAFNNLKIQRVFAAHLSGNEPSGKVMKKLGMREEGCFRQHILKEGRWYDMHYMGVLKAEFIERLHVHLSGFEDRARRGAAPVS